MCTEGTLAPRHLACCADLGAEALWVMDATICGAMASGSIRAANLGAKNLGAVSIVAKERLPVYRKGTPTNDCANQRSKYF